MLIEIHIIQNHSPSNLNRDDLGAPKTCYFGGVLRSRISSQCIKRSIRMSKEFERLRGGIRTRRLAELISENLKTKDAKARAEKILVKCGLAPKSSKKKEDSDESTSEISKMLVFTSRQAISEMASLLNEGNGKTDNELALEFGHLIGKRVAVPDMALCGRMLETGILKNTTVEAALQATHAISTHQAYSEVDYYVAADDIPGEDAGAGFVDEAMFTSACFYKYFSINWEVLCENLRGFGEGHKKLAAHTVGAFIRAAALVNPTGKQNSFAAHNLPDAILVEFKDTPVSYANAFAKPVTIDQRDIISQSIAQLANYVYDIETGYFSPKSRFWFSPNLKWKLQAQVEESNDGSKDRKRKEEVELPGKNLKSLDSLLESVISELGFDWEDVQKVAVNDGVS